MRVIFHGGPLDRCTQDWDDPPFFYRHLIPEPLSFEATEMPSVLEVRTQKVAVYRCETVVLPSAVLGGNDREEIGFYVLEEIS